MIQDLSSRLVLRGRKYEFSDQCTSSNTPFMETEHAEFESLVIGSFFVPMIVRLNVFGRVILVGIFFQYHVKRIELSCFARYAFQIVASMRK